MSHVGTTSPFLPLPDGIVIASVRPTTSRLVVQVACCHSSATCPLCQQSSERVRGTYVRTVADLPCGGRLIILSLLLCAPRSAGTIALPATKRSVRQSQVRTASLACAACQLLFFPLLKGRRSAAPSRLLCAGLFRWAQPERDMCRLHGFLNDVEQVLTQLIQVHLIAD